MYFDGEALEAVPENRSGTAPIERFPHIISKGKNEISIAIIRSGESYKEKKPLKSTNVPYFQFRRRILEILRVKRREGEMVSFMNNTFPLLLLPTLC